MLREGKKAVTKPAWFNKSMAPKFQEEMTFIAVNDFFCDYCLLPNPYLGHYESSIKLTKLARS